MGTETASQFKLIYNNFVAFVKLNNPLMGTETVPPKNTNKNNTFDS